MWIWGPEWKGWCSLEVFSFTLCFITKEKGTESSKILKLFIHDPLLTRDDVRWYFPGLCVVSETTMWHTRHAPWPLSLMFPYSQKVMIVLRPSLYSVVSDLHVLGLFVPLPPAVLLGITQEGNISWKRLLAELCFLVLCSSSFTHRTKTPWFLFHLP